MTIKDIDVTRKNPHCESTLLSPWHSKTVRCRMTGCTNRHKWWNFKGEQVFWKTDDEGRPIAWGMGDGN